MAADPNDAHVKVARADSIVSGRSATTTPRPSTSSRKLSLPTTDGALGYCVALRFYFALQALAAHGRADCEGAPSVPVVCEFSKPHFLKSTIAAAADAAARKQAAITFAHPRGTSMNRQS
jgi:hypothetical protein